MSADALVLPVEQGRFNTDVQTSGPRRNPYEVYAARRLSTFHMPRAIAIEVDPNGACMFDLLYPNEEPAEKRVRRHTGLPDWGFVLGRNSRKLLRVVLENASRHLGHAPSSFDPNVAESWVGELPGHAQFAASRNAVVVAEILAAMPDEVRQSILTALRGTISQPGVSPER